MDISLPLRSLTPSLDSEVLAVLARSESGFGATQVAKLARRGSRAGATKVLDRLAEHGLVLAEPTNRGHMYRLNRDHLLMPALLAALDVRHEFLRRLGAATAALHPVPLHASLFGSFARGEGNQDSDIDLFLLTDADLELELEPNWQKQMRQLEDHVHAWTGNRLEMLSMDSESFTRAVTAGERIVNELQTDAVTLYGIDIGSLITTTRTQGVRS